MCIVFEKVKDLAEKLVSRKVRLRQNICQKFFRLIIEILTQDIFFGRVCALICHSRNSGFLSDLGNCDIFEIFLIHQQDQCCKQTFFQ